MLITLKELVLVPQSILQQSLNTWLLKFLSSQAMPPRTTRKLELFLDTSYSPSETTKNSTNFYPTLLLPKVVSSPTFQEPPDPAKKAQETNPKLCDYFYQYFFYYTLNFLLLTVNSFQISPLLVNSWAVRIKTNPISNSMIQLRKSLAIQIKYVNYQINRSDLSQNLVRKPNRLNLQFINQVLYEFSLFYPLQTSSSILIEYCSQFPIFFLRFLPLFLLLLFILGSYASRAIFLNNTITTLAFIGLVIVLLAIYKFNPIFDLISILALFQSFILLKLLRFSYYFLFPQIF